MTRKTQEEVIEAIRSVAQTLGTDVLTQHQFFVNTDVTISDVLRYFPKWSDACHAAGVESDKSRDKVPDEEVLANWGFVTRNLGHVPSLTEYKVNGKYARNVFDRFGKWVDVPDAFRKFFVDSDEWADVLALLDQHQLKQKKKKTITESITTHQSGLERRSPKLKNRPIYGDPIDFRGLRHEPVNEQGVVFLFGMVARELGYLVEAIQAGYPDCEAKRQIARGQWQPVRIEFEYLSRNFVDHAHDPEQCDVIVCWINNWADCPNDIEVLALSEIITKL
jgi:hypothetical protein